MLDEKVKENMNLRFFDTHLFFRLSDWLQFTFRPDLSQFYSCISQCVSITVNLAIPSREIPLPVLPI